MAQPPPTPLTTEDAAASSDAVSLAMRRADHVFLGLLLAVRMTGYGLLLLLAIAGGPWRNLLAGVLVADTSTWLLASLRRLRHERGWVAVELLLYMAVVVVGWRLQPLPVLPGDAEGNGMAMLGFLGMFALKGSVLAWRMVQDDDE